MTFYRGSIINDASPVVPFAFWLLGLGWVGLGWCIKWLCLLDVSDFQFMLLDWQQFLLFLEGT